MPVIFCVTCECEFCGESEPAQARINAWGKFYVLPPYKWAICEGDRGSQRVWCRKRQCLNQAMGTHQRLEFGQDRELELIEKIMTS